MSNKIKYVAGAALVAGAGAVAYRQYQNGESNYWQQQQEQQEQQQQEQQQESNQQSE